MIVNSSIGNVAIIHFGQAENANVFTPEGIAALIEALDRIADSPAPALILTGAGAVFSADTAQWAGAVTVEDWQRLSARMASMPCLTIAALGGPVTGQALGLVLACDLRIAAQGIRISGPAMRSGALPPAGDARRLVALIGPARTKLMLMAGQAIPAEEARDWGLIDRVTTPAALMETAQALAAEAVASAPDQIMAVKALIA